MINGLIYLIRARAPDYVKGNVSFGTCSLRPSQAGSEIIQIKGANSSHAYANSLISISFRVS